MAVQYRELTDKELEDMVRRATTLTDDEVELVRMQAKRPLAREEKIELIEAAIFAIVVIGGLIWFLSEIFSFVVTVLIFIPWMAAVLQAGAKV